MTKKNRLIGIGILAAVFAVSAKADVWYEGNGVTVNGTGSASVSYTSETETSARLDITVADDSTATLTSLTSDPSVTLSIQKLGSGRLLGRTQRGRLRLHADRA